MSEIIRMTPASERTKLVRTEKTSVPGMIVEIHQDLGIKHLLRGLFPPNGMPAIRVPNGVNEEGEPQARYHSFKLRTNQYAVLKSVPIEAK